MKRNYFIFALTGAALLFAASCKKDIPDFDNTYPGSTGSNGALSNYLAQAAPPLQTFTLNASSGGIFTGVGGTRVIFAGGAFLYQNNQPVSGNVTVELIEVFSKKDMITTGGSTTSNGVPIISAGEAKVTAWQGTQELKLAYPGAMTLNIPAGTNPSSTMQNFFADDLNADEDFERVDTANVPAVPDSMSQASATYYYIVPAYGFGWTNVDQFMSNASAMTPYSVSVPAMFNDTNTMVIFSLNDFNSLAHVYSFDPALNAFTSGLYYQMPVGFNVTFMAISEINGQFYYAEQQMIVGTTCAVSLVPQPCTQAYIDQKLDAL